jgi:hypothetical protein
MAATNLAFVSAFTSSMPRTVSIPRSTPLAVGSYSSRVASRARASSAVFPRFIASHSPSGRTSHTLPLAHTSAASTMASVLPGVRYLPAVAS